MHVHTIEHAHTRITDWDTGLVEVAFVANAIEQLSEARARACVYEGWGTGQFREL